MWLERVLLSVAVRLHVCQRLSCSHAGMLVAHGSAWGKLPQLCDLLMRKGISNLVGNPREVLQEY